MWNSFIFLTFSWGTEQKKNGNKLIVWFHEYERKYSTGEVDKTDRTELGKCIHLYDETQGNTSTFDKNCLRQVQQKWIIIKEEGSKEEDRQEEGDVKIFLLRMYTQI